MRPAGPMDFLAVDAALGRLRERAGPEVDGWLAGFWARFGAAPPVAYVSGDQVALLDGTGEHRIVVFADPGCLPDLVAALRADPGVRAISLAEPHEGFREAERWEHRLDLVHTPAAPASLPAGYEVMPWDPGRQGEAAELLVATNSGTLDGLFLAWPGLPDRGACERLLAGFAAGSHGRFLPEVSFMAVARGRLAGLTLVSEAEPGEALLLEIAVRLRHRGTGLARHLSDGIKCGLRPRRFAEVRFLSCGGNRAVWALFRPEEVTSRLLGRNWVWMRD